MADWSNNNRAHVLTWHSLFVLNQLSTGFKESAALTVADLTFFGSAASGDLTDVQAEALGIQLDNMFRLIFGAAYEEGITGATAIPALQGALKKKKTTLPELGRLADSNYRFLGEVLHA